MLIDTYKQNNSPKVFEMFLVRKQAMQYFSNYFLSETKKDIVKDNREHSTGIKYLKDH